MAPANRRKSIAWRIQLFFRFFHTSVQYAQPLTVRPHLYMNAAAPLYQPRREWFSLGLSAHHLCIDAGSGRRLNLNHKSLVACVHGVVNVCSVVVRTTEKMVIHWECGTYHQRRYQRRKDSPSV